MEGDSKQQGFDIFKTSLSNFKMKRWNIVKHVFGHISMLYRNIKTAETMLVILEI